MKDEGYKNRMQDAEYRMKNAGCRILDEECWMQDTGCRLKNEG